MSNENQDEMDEATEGAINFEIDDATLEAISGDLGISPKEALSALKFISRQREGKGGSKKWSDLSAEEKAKRLAYTKEYNGKKNSRLKRIASLATKNNFATVEDYLTHLES